MSVLVIAKLATFLLASCVNFDKYLRSSFVQIKVDTRVLLKVIFLTDYYIRLVKIMRIFQ